MALAKRHKKHKKHEDHVDESWLVPYADILTLLLALFIVLFASSTVDQQKLVEMENVFNQIFSSGSGVMDNPSPVTSPNSSSTEVTKYQQDQAALQELQESVEEFIAVNELENQFETQMTDEGLLLTIRDSILFAPGDAEVNPDYIPLAQELSQVLTIEGNRNVIITGHTDNVPMNNEKFSSNWELSVMRAVNFLAVLMEYNAQLDGKHFSAKGHGEFNPIDTNDTDAGRAKNRRVEVLIQPLVAEDGSDFTSSAN
jgi:chemotaxis protein MotB